MKINALLDTRKCQRIQLFISNENPQPSPGTVFVLPWTAQQEAARAKLPKLVSWFG